jgi:hypothetical protein
MPRRIEEIAADLEALESQDFDGTRARFDGMDRLSQLCEELRAIEDVQACAPVLFRTMERLGETELGSPGPLVHTLETWRGGYERFLAESVSRKPTYLSVWMVNRLLNARPSDAEAWLDLLRSVAHDPAASDEARSAASDFLAYQGRG